MRMTINIWSLAVHHHYLTKATAPLNIFSGKKLPGHPFLPSTHFLAIFIQVNWILTYWEPLYLHCEVNSLSFFLKITFSFFKKITFPFFWSSNPLKFLKPLFLQCALLFEDKEGWPGSPTFHSVFPVQGFQKSIPNLWDFQKVFPVQGLPKKYSNKQTKVFSQATIWQTHTEKENSYARFSFLHFPQQTCTIHYLTGWLLQKINQSNVGDL